jgi:hypothetical protein
VTGALTGIGTDERTLYDTSLTQPGPSGGIAITGISQANPGVVTLAADLGLPNGSPITISGVVGMVNVNTNTYAVSVSGNTFTLPVDTTHYPAYISGGFVTPLGGDSGFFDNGVITFTSGANVGRSMEIQSYVPGQLILFEPLPYTPMIGDTYTIHAGCDYSQSTCRVRFNNIFNFRGEPFIPGVDRLIQIGKQ